jgi:hypothetical protein
VILQESIDELLRVAALVSETQPIWASHLRVVAEAAKFVATKDKIEYEAAWVGGGDPMRWII